MYGIEDDDRRFQAILEARSTHEEGEDVGEIIKNAVEGVRAAHQMRKVIEITRAYTEELARCLSASAGIKADTALSIVRAEILKLE